MNLFELATRGVDLDALPAGRSPERESAVSAPVEFAVPQDLNAAFDAAADEYGVDADVLRAMAYAESRFRPDVMAGQVKSRTGATGLMQFMPETAKRFGIDPTDPVESIFGAAAYMRANLEKFDGDYDKAVAAYNWGENRQAYGRPDWKDRLPAETRGYLDTVFGAADELKLRAPAQPESKTEAAPKNAPQTAPETAKEPAPIPERTWGEAFGDTTKSLAQGLLDVGSLPGVAYSAVTGDWDTGYLKAIRGTQEVLQDQKSAEIQARNKELQSKLSTAEGWREKLAVGGIETLKDPTLLFDTLARSAPGMFAGGGVGRGAGAAANAAGNAAFAKALGTGSELAARIAVTAKNGAGVLARATATGTAAGIQGASVASDTYDELSKLPVEAFKSEPEWSALEKQHGAQQAKEILAGAAANRALLMATGASVLSMKLVPGGDAIEKMFLPKALKGEAAKAAVASTSLLTRPMGKGMDGGLVSKAVELIVKGSQAGALESVSEGVEEGTGAIAKGLELSRAGQRVSLSEMAGEAYGQGAAAGLVMGKVAGMQSAYADSAPTVESQPKTPTVPPVSPSPVAPPVQPQAPTADDLPAQILQAEQTKDAGSLPTVEQRDTGTVMLRGGDVAAVSQQLQDAGIEHARIPGGILVGATGAQAAAQMFAPPTETQPNAPTPANPGEETTPAPSAQGAPEAAVVLQNRNRSTPSSVAQMRSIAANPDYGRLGFSRDFANGAPVVAGGAIPAAQLGRQDTATASNGRRIPVQYAVVDAADVLTSNRVDGSPNVEYGNEQVQAVRAVAGNGRIAGLQAAYQANQAAQYTQELAQDSALHGVDPRVIAAMKNPVLVRVMPQSEITADIGDLSNTTGGLSLSAVEQANNDANRVDLAELQFSEDGSLTTEAVRQFVRAMPQAEQGGLIDTTGQPSKQAIDRLQAAVFAKAYGNDQLIRLFAQAQDPEARNILSALSQVANKMARLEGAGALDIRDVVAQAAEIAVNAKREGKAMAIAAQQMDMAADPDVSVVLDLFASNMRRVKAIVEALGNAADFAYTEANKPDADMFGEVPRATRADIINQLRPENERGSQEALENAAGREPVAVDAVGQANEPAGSAALAEAQASRPAEDAANPEGLTSYTAEEATQRQEEAELAAKAEAARQRAADQAASQDENRKRIAQASVRAAAEFELGQNPLDSLTGQGSMFDDAPEQPASRTPEIRYELPPEKSAQQQGDESWMAAQSPSFKPTARQQLLMDAVAKALDDGAFYSRDINEYVAKTLGVTKEQRARNSHNVEGGDFGYDVYNASKAVEAQRGNAKSHELAKALNLKPGDVLGTLVFNDGKVTTGVKVVSLNESGLVVTFTGKRGAATLNAEARVDSLAAALDRAHEKGKRKDSYEAFIAGRAADKQATEQPPARTQQAQAATETVAQSITRADVTAAQQQAAAMIAERIDAMTAGEVNTIARRFLPTMGVKPTVSKERNKVAVTDFTKVNPMAAADEFGVTLPADVRRALDAEMQGKVADAGQDDGVNPRVPRENRAPASLQDGITQAQANAARFEIGKSLTKEQRKQVLDSLVDVYKSKGAEREFKGQDGNGNDRYGYAHSPDLFEKSDITGAMVRYYVTLPDGRIAHPTELFPDVSASDIERMALEQEANSKSEKAFENAIKPFYQDFDSANLMTIAGQVVISKGDRFAIIPNRIGAVNQARQQGWELAKPAPADVRRVLQADMEGRVVDVAQDEGVTKAMGQAPAEPNPLDYTPKQYADAWLRWAAESNGLPLAEVREMQGDEAGLKAIEQRWVDAVVQEAKSGQPLPARTLDKLLEVRPNAQLPESAIPDGYQRSQARKQEADEKQARADNRKKVETKEDDAGNVVKFSRSGAQSANANDQTSRSWYDRFVSLLPDAYRNDPHRREPLPAEDWNVQRAAEVHRKVEAINQQLRGENDRKGYGPISIDGLGNLQVSALQVSRDDLNGPIKALAKELGAGIAITNVRTGDIQALQDSGFVPETSLAPVADRIMGRPFDDPANRYAADARAYGTIMTYQPRGFPAVMFARDAAAQSSGQPLRTPATTIRASITKAYGKLLGQLESKGLVTLTQTEDEAIEAAARARADKTGQPLAEVRASLMGSVSNSVATDTPAFKRWFAGSKVVDADGKPLVVMHASTYGDISEFKKEAQRFGKAGFGFYFSDASGSNLFAEYGDRFQMERSASGEQKAVKTYPVYLSLQNPLVVDHVDDLARHLDRGQKFGVARGLFGNLPADAMLWLQRQGYDGIITRETTAPRVHKTRGLKILDRNDPKAVSFPVYVAFEPAQIKSAIGNNGNFDPNDLDIRRSANGAIQGFFDPQTGQSFLIADNLTAEAAPGTLMHEVGIHMAADGSMKALFNRAAMMLKLQRGNPFMKAVQARMDAAGETSGEEAAAYIAEAYENDRANAPASVQRWLTDLLAAVKAWMFKKGIMGADRLTVADIAAVARANARTLANGVPVDAGSNGTRKGGGLLYSIQRDKQGMPVIEGDGVTLQYGQPTDRLEFIPTDDSHQMLRFAVSTDANPFAGYVDALFQDGKPVALYDIFMEPDQRKGGSATKAVKALLDASPDGKLDISNIVTEAQEFWAKMGIPTQPNQPKGYAYDGTITQESFAASDAGKNAGTTRSDLPRGSGVRQAQDGRGRAGRSEESRAGTDGIEVSELTWEQAQAQGLKFSKKQAQQQALDLATPQWQLPDATKTDRLIYELQDGRIDLKRAQEAIAKAGRTITEGFDARLAETLMPGRVAYRTETFLKVEVQPLLEAMARNKVSQDELSDYLLARHAPERNAQISKINPDMPDGGAGTNSQGVLMTTQAARDHIAGLTSGKRTALELLARQVDALTQGTREMLVREGLEKQETIDAWTGAYQHYVPLFKDEAMETPGHPIGSGFSVTGSASKRSTGSSGEVTNMVAHILMQREAAITRAEKNRVAMSLYGLALTHPNAQMWTTVRPSMSDAQIEAELQRMGVDPVEAQSGMQGAPTIRAVDPVTGLVVDRPNPLYKRMDNALVVKVNGEDRVILFNKANPRALRMVQNLKNQDGVIGLDMAGSVVGRATRYLAAINTQYNPAFGMVNIVRDLGGAMVNLTDTPLAGKQARVLGDSIAAMQGIARDLRGDSKRTPWSDLWKQFQEDGGRTGYRDLFIDPYKRAESVQGDLDKLSKAGKLTPGAAAHAVLDLLDDFNTTLENGVRLSAYKAALDMGMSRSAAARVARELTLDFNRKGRTGRELGPLYAFFNASIQGTARTVQALKGPAGKRILAGGLSLGVVQALMLAAAGFDDDEIPEFIKARAFIIPMPGKQYIAIPLQFGLNALPNTGRVVTELLMSGGREWQEKTFDAVGELAGSFNPMGGGNIFTASGALKTIAPTVLDPLIEMGTNTGFSGQPIAKERMPWDTRPGFTMGRESTQRAVTGQVYVGISQAINRLTFGDDYTRGLASPAPEHVRYVFTTVGGGVFRELEKALSAAVLTAKGEDLKAREVPLGSRFAGEVDDEQVQRSRYYKNHARMEKLEAKLKGLAKDGKGEELRQFVLDEPAVKLYEANNQVAGELARLNKLAVENITDKEALKRIDAARTNTMRVLNDKVREMEKR